MLGQFVGVPGVGKTSVINGLVKKLQEDGIDTEVISFGSVIFNIAKKKFNIKSRDEIRKKIPKLEYEKIQLEAAELVGSMNKKDRLIIVDNHLVIETNFGYYSGIYREMEEKMNSDFIVVIIANPEDILKRRIEDKTRDRDIEDIWRIELQQNMTLSYATTMMHLYNTPVIVIKNEQGKLNEAINELYNKLRSLIEYHIE